MTVERIATIHERIAGGARREDVLGPEGLEPSAWTAAQRLVVEQLARELRRGERKLADRYLAARAARRSPPPLDATVVVTAVALDAPLPFAGAVQAPPPVAREVAAEADAMSGATTTIAALSEHDIGGTLPFD